MSRFLLFFFVLLAIVGTGIVYFIYRGGISFVVEPSASPNIDSPLPSIAMDVSPSPASTPKLVRGYVPRLPTKDRVIALTFDGGGNAAGVKTILATLHARRIPGTFFLTGNFIKKFPAETRDIFAYVPADMGNHSYSHPHFPALSEEKKQSEIKRTEDEAARLGRSLTPYFRFPYGEYKPEDLSFIESLGYIAVGWTVDTAGWKGTSGGESVHTIRERIRKRAGPGGIILMHLGSHPQDKSTLDADVLPFLLDDLTSQGYRFVRLSEYVSF